MPQNRLNRRECLGALATTSFVSLTAGCLGITSSQIADMYVSDPVYTIEIEDTNGPIRISANYDDATLRQLVTAVIDTSKEELIFPPLTEENPVQDSMSALTAYSDSQGIVIEDSSASFQNPDPIQFTAEEGSTYSIILSPFLTGISRDDIDVNSADIEVLQPGKLSDNEGVLVVNSDPTPINDLQPVIEDILITDGQNGRYEGFIEYFSSNKLDLRERAHYFGAFLVFAEAYRRLNRSTDEIDQLWDRLVAADIRAAILEVLNEKAEQLLDFCILVIQLKYSPPREILNAIEQTLRERMRQIASFQVPIDTVQYNSNGEATAPTRINIEADISSPVATEFDKLELAISTPGFRFPLNYDGNDWEPRDLGEIAREEARELIEEIDASINI